jgi:phenylpyruvate tautomerase PptA (4-oxalocrotonate tautomerase family)
MPILIQLSAGLLSPEGEKTIFPRVARALLDVHGLADNGFMTPNVIGHVVVTPSADTYAGGEAQSLAVIEVKVPSVTFPSPEVKQAFVAKVTDIVHELRAGDHPRSRTFVNVTYAVDGTWGIGGKAYTNAELGQAIASAAR